MIKDAWFRFLKWHASGRRLLGHQIVQSAKFYIAHYFYESCGIERNGEALLLRRLAGRASMIFDVGANCGEWSSIASEHHPDATIHAFELVLSTYALLEGAVAEGVIIHPFGLAEQGGTVEVEVDRDDHQISSFYSIPGFHRVTDRFECRVERGDEFCDQQGITEIDLLKVDAEGAEPLVIKGFGGLIVRGAINVIQFEYGYANIAARFLLADFYELLGKRYAIGLLTKRGVVFRDYSVEHETFQGPNYVAVARRRPDLIDLLSA